MKKLINFIVYGNILIGFAAFSLSQFFMKILLPHSDQSIQLSLFLFAATTFTYGFHRRMDHALKGRSDLSATTLWMIQHPILSKLINIFSFTLSLYFIIEIPKSSFLIIIPVSVISLLYVQSLSEKRKLREIPLLKIFLISLVWTLCILVLPLTKSLSFELSHLPISIGFFFFMIAQIIPFDIRDIRGDENEKLKTIPILLREKKSKIAVLIFLALSSLFMMSALVPLNTTQALFPFLASCIYLGILSMNINEKRSDLYYSFFIESSLIMPYLLCEFIGLL